MCSSSTLWKSKCLIRSLPFHTPQKQWRVKSMMFTLNKSRKRCLGPRYHFTALPFPKQEQMVHKQSLEDHSVASSFATANGSATWKEKQWIQCFGVIILKARVTPSKKRRSYSTLMSRNNLTSSPPQSTITTSLLGLSLPSVGFFSTFKEVNSILYQNWPQSSCGRKQWSAAYRSHHIHALDHLAKDHVPAIQPGGLLHLWGGVRDQEQYRFNA